MKTIFALLTVGVLLLSHPAFARLGENEEACKKRYGDVVRILDGWDCAMVWRYNDFTITASFLAGKCEQILYQKVAAIPIEEIRVLLSLNSEGLEWERLDDNSWSRKDGARAVASDDGLRIASPRFIEKWAEYHNDEVKKREDEVRKRLKGL